MAGLYPDQIKCFLMAIVFLSFFTALSTSSLISGGFFGSQDTTGRRLLQARKRCPVNFESQNYTIITSRCTGPNYSNDSCCSSFLEFACPFVDDLNDLGNDCASTMFSYINLRGKYPPGLFSGFCRGGLDGLDCPEVPPPSASSDAAAGTAGGWRLGERLIMPMFIVTSLVLFTHFT